MAVCEMPAASSASVRSGRPRGSLSGLRRDDEAVPVAAERGAVFADDVDDVLQVLHDRLEAVAADEARTEDDADARRPCRRRRGAARRRCCASARTRRARRCGSTIGGFFAIAARIEEAAACSCARDRRARRSSSQRSHELAAPRREALRRRAAAAVGGEARFVRAEVEEAEVAHAAPRERRRRCRGRPRARARPRCRAARPSRRRACTLRARPRSSRDAARRAVAAICASSASICSWTVRAIPFGRSASGSDTSPKNCAPMPAFAHARQVDVAAERGAAGAAARARLWRS